MIRNLLVAIFLLCASLTCVAQDEPPQEVSQDLLVCGPRCVKSILEHYGQEADLIELVKEMQIGDVSTGCSLFDIEQALHRRGIQTKAVQLGFLQFPNPQKPVILHYSDGHFVVLDQVDWLYSRIRDGVGMTPDWHDLPSVIQQQSGTVLFTSNDQSLSIRLIRWPRVTLGLFVIALGGFGLFVHRRNRTNAKKSEEP